MRHAGLQPPQPPQPPLQRALALVAAFAPGEGWLDIARLARLTGLPRATVSRLCAVLVERNWLQRDELGCVMPAVRLMAQGNAVLQGIPLRDLARPLMQQMADESGAVVSLLAAQGDDAVFIETAERLGTPMAHPDSGHRLPLTALAAGRALLSLRPDMESQRIIGNTPLARRPQADITLRAIADCRSRGHCLSIDGVEAGERSIGLPLLVLPGGLPLALGCTLSRARLAPGVFDGEVVPRAIALAATLRQAWSASPDRPVRPSR